MKIFWWLFRRICRAPFFAGLLAAFLALNFYLISTGSYQQRKIDLVNDVAGQTGVQINADFQKKFSPILQKYTQDLAGLYRKKTGKSAVKPEAMVQELQNNEWQMTAAERDRLGDDAAILQLDHSVQSRSSTYAGLDFAAEAKNFCSKQKLSGLPASIIANNAAALQKRVDEIRSDGEADTLYFPGAGCRTHSSLYGRLFKAILLESAVLGVLIMLYTVNFEFAHGTQGLAYTSRRGRTLLADQFCAAMLAGLAVPALLMAVALPAFFASFHFSNLWNASVSSAMNVETENGFFPCITWSRMTVLQYLWANIGLVFALQAVFCLLAFTLAVFCHSSYADFLLYGFVGFVLAFLPEYLPWNSALPFFAAANPFTAWKICGSWLARSEPACAYPQYFTALFVLWGAISAILIFFGTRRFRRADL